MSDGDHTIEQVASSKPRRRFIRFPHTFTLRVLLLSVLVAAIGFAALAWQINVFREQEAAAKRISDRRGGGVWAKYAWEPAQPVWFWGRIAQWTGVRCEYVVAVEISTRRCDMEDAACWRKMPRIRGLRIRTGVTGDDVVDQIADLHHLESLELLSAVMANGPEDIPAAPSNKGVQRFTQLRHLKRLAIQVGVRLKDDGSLEFLLDDEGMLPITTQLNLESLDISASYGVTINAIRPLLARHVITKLCLPRGFVNHVDELLDCPSLNLIAIRELPQDIQKKAPDRLCDSSFISFREFDFQDFQPRHSNPIVD